MLMLSRREGEVVVLSMGGQSVRVVVYKAHTNRVDLGFDAPKDVIILREELCDAGSKLEAGGGSGGGVG